MTSVDDANDVLRRIVDELEKYFTDLLGAAAFPAAFSAATFPPAFHAAALSNPGLVRIVLKCAHDPLPDQPAGWNPHLVSDYKDRKFFMHVVNVVYDHARRLVSKIVKRNEIQEQVLQHRRDVFAKLVAADPLPADWPPVPTCVEHCALYQPPRKDMM